MYVKDCISNGVKVVRNHFDSVIWLKLDKHFFKTDCDIYIAGLYVWGENSPAYNVIDVDFFTLLQDDINDFQLQGKVILCGDWNARVGNGSRPDYIAYDSIVNSIDDDDYLPDLPSARRSLDKVCNSHGLKLLDLCKSTALRIANGRLGNDHSVGMYTYASRTGCSVIDYVILGQNDFGCIKNFQINTFCEWSDHAPLSFGILTNTIPDIPDRPQCRTRIKWDDALCGDFRRSLIGRLTDFNSIVNQTDISDGNSVNSCIEKFTAVIKEVASPLFSKTTYTDTASKPRLSANQVCKKAEWFDEECRTAKHAYFNALNSFNSCKTDENRINMFNVKAVYKSLVKKKKRNFEGNKIKEIVKLKHAKPREFWKLFSKRNKNVSNIPLNDFFEYFSNMHNDLFNVQDRESEYFCQNNDFDSNNCTFEELDIPITLAEVEFVIRSLKRNKSFSCDQLLNEYFIESFDILSGHIVDIFNAILNSGVFPRQWTEGILVPLFKKNDPNDVNNYRGITLVSCFSKIFTGVLNNRLNKWAESNDVLSDSQFGFRKGRSTIDAIFVLNSIIQKVLKEKGRLFCAFIDLKKAFDSVYLNGLWFKLFNLGLNGKILRVLKDMYTKVKTCVRGCNSYSDFFECAIGLKQGEVLSPALFSLFIEDLELFLQNDQTCGLTFDDITFILMLFADDMVILGKDKDDLQTSLHLLETYCHKWGLQVNTDKTKIVVFRKRGGLLNDEAWTYKGSNLEVVSNFNYLGTIFNYTGNFALNQETLVGKGLKAMNCLIHNTKRYPFKPKVMCQLFDAFVGSILSYSCEIWGFGKCKEIERIHLKFCKYLLKVKSSTCNIGVYGELQRYPLYISRYTRIIKFWCHIINSDNILVNKLYSSLVDACSIGVNTNNWAKSVKSLLDNYGFSYVWNDPFSVNLKTFHLQFKQRVLDVFKQSWYNDIANSRAITLYKYYKLSFDFEHYLNILPKKLRMALSQLRLSSHQLRIETGRYAQNRVDREQRICTLCNKSDIEDEYHFVLVCPVYSHLRQKYIRPFYFKRPSVHKFTLLMQTKQQGVLQKLGKYVYESFALRRSLMTS